MAGPVCHHVFLYYDGAVIPAYSTGECVGPMAGATLSGAQEFYLYVSGRHSNPLEFSTTSPHRHGWVYQDQPLFSIRMFNHPPRQPANLYKSLQATAYSSFVCLDEESFFYQVLPKAKCGRHGIFAPYTIIYDDSAQIIDGQWRFGPQVIVEEVVTEPESLEPESVTIVTQLSHAIQDVTEVLGHEIRETCDVPVVNYGGVHYNASGHRVPTPSEPMIPCAVVADYQEFGNSSGPCYPLPYQESRTSILAAADVLPDTLYFIDHNRNSQGIYPDPTRGFWMCGRFERTAPGQWYKLSLSAGTEDDLFRFVRAQYQLTQKPLICIVKGLTREMEALELFLPHEIRDKILFLEAGDGNTAHYRGVQIDNQAVNEYKKKDAKQTITHLRGDKSWSQVIKRGWHLSYPGNHSSLAQVNYLEAGRWRITPVRTMCAAPIGELYEFGTLQSYSGLIQSRLSTVDLDQHQIYQCQGAQVFPVGNQIVQGKFVVQTIPRSLTSGEYRMRLKNLIGNPLQRVRGPEVFSSRQTPGIFINELSSVDTVRIGTEWNERKYTRYRIISAEQRDEKRSSPREDIVQMRSKFSKSTASTRVPWRIRRQPAISAAKEVFESILEKVMNMEFDFGAWRVSEEREERRGSSSSRRAF